MADIREYPDGKEIKTEQLAPEIKELVNASAEARELAYCPYSKFSVGAALRAKNGQIFTGCNIENASLGATICAERTAAVKAISQGVKEFTSVAVIGGKTRPFSPPCGMCRQFLIEFGDITVICVNTDLSTVKFHSLSSLIPESFRSF